MDLSSSTKCDKDITMIIVTFVTPKAAAKLELVFNKPVSRLPTEGFRSLKDIVLLIDDKSSYQAKVILISLLDDALQISLA
jgi:hypothetical protein